MNNSPALAEGPGRTWGLTDGGRTKSNGDRDGDWEARGGAVELHRVSGRGRAGELDNTR